ncbi:hypothetical protein N0V90_003457 [Kalmusia sp. IMI 367209]|nr:hypothetical protein N0V90_003457 [Kalmusia sp. IMI 367209]
MPIKCSVMKRRTSAIIYRIQVNPFFHELTKLSVFVSNGQMQERAPVLIAILGNIVESRIVCDNPVKTQILGKDNREEGILYEIKGVLKFRFLKQIFQKITRKVSYLANHEWLLATGQLQPIIQDDGIWGAIWFAKIPETIVKMAKTIIVEPSTMTSKHPNHLSVAIIASFNER